jgi:protein-S-isoprenylcysteine O-methyltransferase Ste14
VGLSFTVAGALLLLSAFVRFVVEGLGTPAPIAPTQRLVIGGLYRWVRNPMYLAVELCVVGQGILLGRPVLLVYAMIAGLTMWSFVKLYEEPTLARRYGAEYEQYRREVPGWWPRLRLRR